MLSSLVGGLYGQARAALTSGLAATFGALSATSAAISGALTAATYQGVTFLSGSAAPNAGGGVAATAPALYWRTGTLELWLKIGSGDTAWALLSAGTGSVNNPTFSGTVSAGLLSGQASLSHTGFTGYVELSVLSPTQLGSSQNNYNPGVAAFQRWSASTPVSVTGLSAGNGGRIHVIVNINASAITIEHEDAASTAANRFTCGTGADIVLAQNEAILAVYDATTARWRTYKL